MLFNYLSPVKNLFCASEKFCNIVDVQITLKDEVDGNILDEAVQQALIRHSHFSIKLRRTKDGKRLDILHNDKKVVVTPNKDNLEFVSSQTNEHMQYVQYDKKTVIFYMLHAFCDGGSFFKYLHTILYLYVSKRNKAEIDKNGVWLPGDERFPDENIDPMLKSEELSEKLGKDFTESQKNIPSDIKIFNMNSLGNYSLKNTMYKMTLPKETFIKFSKSVNSSPAAIFPGLLTKSIFELKSSSEKEIIVGIVMHNARNTLDCPNSWIPFSNTVSIIYTDSMRQMTDKNLYSVCRSSLYKQLDKDSTIKRFLKNAKFSREILSNDFKTAVSIARNRSESDKSKATFTTSYVGQLGWGNLESYIEEVAIPVAPSINGLTVELTSVNNIFTVTITQPFEEDIYVKQLKKLLEENGIVCKLSGAISFNPPYYLPEHIKKYE